jgi:circadian clock protein KaiB
MVDVIQLRLFITGETSRSREAVLNLRRITEQIPEDLIEIEIIDVLEQPDLAEQERILATPALIRTLPLPERRIIGNLKDSERVWMGLGLEDAAVRAEEESR